MSFLMAGTGLSLAASLLVASDDRVAPSHHRRNSVQAKQPWENGLLWTSSRTLGQQVGFGNLFGTDASDNGRFAADVELDTGAQSQKKIIGFTKDASGNPLGSVTIEAFLTATDVKQGAVVSDASGYFECPVPTAGTHYLVAYKGGSPNLAGSTGQDLTGV